MPKPNKPLALAAGRLLSAAEFEQLRANYNEAHAQTCARMDEWAAVSAQAAEAFRRYSEAAQVRDALFDQLEAAREALALAVYAEQQRMRKGQDDQEQ